jgi:hypothetical protein
MTDAPKPGDKVILISVPPSLLADLPPEDQAAIRNIVGKPVTLEQYDYGQAVLEFEDGDHTHWIYVDTNFIRPA